LIKFFLSPKVLVFHKEANDFTTASKVKDVEVAQAAVQTGAPKQNTKERLREVQKLLEQKAEEQRKLAGEIR
jgi:hypothetical protein